MRRGRHSAETGSHPFRSMFDLMLALVLLLLAAFALPRARADYDMKSRGDELLMLHNLLIRKEQGEGARLKEFLNQLPQDDICRSVENSGVPITEDFKQKLEQHRSKMWSDLGPYVQERLLKPQIKDKIGSGKLNFAPASATPIDTRQLKDILQKVYNQCYDKRNGKILFNRIRVEGHTDSDKLTDTRQFPSNWELSAARACWLSRKIEDDLNNRGVATGPGPKHVLIEAIGYADRVPAPDNDKAQNRRIEIVYEDKPADLSDSAKGHSKQP